MKKSVKLRSLDSVTKPFHLFMAEANEFVAEQVRALLLELKQRLRQGSGGEAPPQPVDPEQAIFQAELMEGAATVLGKLADGLRAQLRERAETLREEARVADSPQQPAQHPSSQQHEDGSASGLAVQPPGGGFEAANFTRYRLNGDSSSGNGLPKEMDNE